MMKTKNKKFDVYDLMIVVLLFFALLLVTNSIGVGHGKSMEPTFSGYTFSVYRSSLFGLDIKRGDIVSVVYDLEDRPFWEQKAEKRVIALPGETVYTPDGCTYYVNNELLEEDYILHVPCSSSTSSKYAGHSWTLSEGEYFVSGDNRNNSLDSRKLGPISRDSIKSVLIKTLFQIHK